jgi:hypothetical protein
MPNEFVAKNGLISQNNVIVSGSVSITGSSGTLLTSNTDTLEITGSLLVTGSATFTGSTNFSSGLTGSLLGTASFANNTTSASYALTATSASFATTASYWTGSVNAVTASFATNAGLLNSTGSNGFTTTGSFQTYTASNDLTNTTQSARLTSLEGVSASFFSYTQSNDAKVSALNSFSSSILSYTSSINDKTGSFATTGSNTFIGNQTVTGSFLQTGSLTVNGTITATTLLVQTITSSQDFVTGSTKFGSLTSNTHQFTGSVSASGSLAVNTNVLYVDGTSVGIGTTGPSSKLHVETSTSNPFRMIRTGGTATHFGFEFGSGDIGFYDYTNSAYRWYVTNNGGLNIGTATGNSISKLNIQADATRFIAFEAISAGGNKTVYIRPVDSGVHLISSNYISGGPYLPLALSARENNADLYLAIDGKIGIGTTSPSASLHIASTGKSLQLGSNASNGGAGIMFAGGSTVKNWFVGNQYNVSNVLEFTPTTTTGSNAIGTTPVMVIADYGNVGIGTSYPTAQVHINSGGSYTNTDANNRLIIERNSHAYTLFVSPDESDQGLHFANTTDNGIVGRIAYFHRAAGDSMNLSVASSIRMTIDYNGSVGIGTTSPSRLLHVAGNGYFYNGSANSSSSVLIQGGRQYELTADASGGGSPVVASGFIIRDNSAGAERLVINASGNIGIGTTSPSYKLHVYSSNGASYFDGGTTDTSFYISHGSYNPGSQTISGIRNNSGSPVFNAKSGGTMYFNRDINTADVHFQYNTGSNTALFISGSGNVGIGTTSPSSKLDVGYFSYNANNKALYVRNSGNPINTTTYDTMVIQQDDVTTLRLVEKNTGATPDQVMTFAIGDGYGRIATSAQPLQFYVNGASGSTGYTGLDGTMALQIGTNGNVGIGTTNTSYKLEVNGQGVYKDNLYVGGADSAAKSLVINGVGATSAVIYFDSTGKTYGLYQGGTQSNYLTGNLGIGTSSPITTLTVGSTDATAEIAPGGGNTHLTLKTVGGGGAIRFYTISGSTGNLATTESMRVNAGGNVGIGTTSPSAKLDVNGSLFSHDYFRVYAGAGNIVAVTTWSGTDSGFINLYNGGSATVQLHSNGSSYFTGGNVGIGSTSPQEYLHIIGTNDFTRGIRFSEAGNNYRNGITFGSPGSSASGWGLDFYTAASSTDTTTNLSLRGNGVSYFNAGSVGIGTTSPSQKLHIMSGSVLAEGGGTNNGVRIGSHSNNVGGAIYGKGISNQIMYFDSTNTVLNGESNILFRIADTDKVVINSSGNVGIGTTSPNTLLVVRKAVNDEWIAKFINTGTNPYGMYVDTSANTSGTYTFAAYTYGGLGLFVINNTGNVGIGTTAPAYKLEVTGEVGINYTNSLMTMKGGTGYSIMRMYGGDGSNTDVVEFQVRNRADSVNMATMGTYSNHDVRIRTNNTDKVTIQAGGNVGIGTTSPLEKLHVDGYILNRSKFGYTSIPDVVKRDLQLYIDFNNKTCWDGNVSSTSIKDLSNNNYTMALYNSATISNKDGNYALYTANNSSYLRAVNYYMANQEHTWEAWINGNAFSGWDTWFDSGTERPLIGAYDGSFQFYPDGSPYKLLTAGKWYHVVIAMNSAKSYSMYVNGTLIGTATYSDTARTGTFDLWIGGDGSAETFNGYVAIARTYSRQLSQTEILQNYNAEKSRFDSSLYNDVASGLVGIGTTNPAGQLSGTKGLSIVDSVNAALGLSNGTNNWLNYLSGTTYRIWNNSYNEVVTIKLDGNVGIGTTSPGCKLDVAGIISSNDKVGTADNKGFYLRGVGDSTHKLYYDTSTPANVWEYNIDIQFRYYSGGSPANRFNFGTGGTLTASGDVIAYGSPSDITLKTNIKPLEDALEKVTKLKGVSFTWKEDTDANKMTGIKDDIGFIAQEVQEVLPDLVRKNDNGLLSLRDKGITALLVESVKELKAQNDALLARIEQLENK